VLLDVLKQQEGTAEPSLVSVNIQKLQHPSSNRDELIRDIKGLGAVMILGGVDTVKSSLPVETSPGLNAFQTTTALQTFVLYLVLYPRVLHRAQQEICDIVGPNRLPDFKDQAALPYLQCVINEVLRLAQPSEIATRGLSFYPPKDEPGTSWRSSSS
jgi:hypothetical protein